MTNKDFFDKVKDPFKNDDYIEFILDRYENIRDLADIDIMSLYSKLCDYYSLKNNVNLKMHNEDEKNQFLIKIFNKWKDKVTSVSNDTYNTLLSNGIYDKSFLDVCNDLSKMSDINNFNDLLYLRQREDFRNYLLRGLLDSSWVYVDSYDVGARLEERMETHHRLYINLDEKDVVFFAEKFIEKCEDKNLKYHFKFANEEKRDDMFIVYSDSDNLLNYYNILTEIKNENKDLASRISHPPFLTGVVDDWIGYGSEPLDTTEKTSYSSLRSEILVDAIKNVTDRYLVDRNKTFPYKNGNYSAIAILNDMMASEKYKTNKEKSYRDLYLDIAKQIDKDFPYFIENSNIIFLDYFKVSSVYKKLPKLLLNLDKNYKNELKDEIVRLFKENNINIDNTCFGNMNVRLLQKADYERDKKNNMGDKDKMKLMDIYYKASNPIEDDKKLYKILEAYGNPSGLYAGLSTASSRNYENGDSFCGLIDANHNEKDKDKFYSKMTNLWLKSIKDMSREYFNERIGTRSFFDLRHQYLWNCSYVNNKKESDELLAGKKLNADLRDALDTYSWTYDSDYWEHVKAGNIHLDKDKFKKCEHRLYVNPDSEDLFEFMNYFVDKCEEKNLSYYFKFCKDFSRDDNFVIYSSTDELTKYIEVLNDIKLEHPDLVSRFKEPPLLTGEINDWIGYGSEPVELNKERVDYSFNSLREKKVLSPAINKVTREWLYENKDKKIKLKGGDLAIRNLISYMAVNDIVDTLKNYIKGKDSETALRENGINLSGLNDINVRNAMFRIIDQKIGDNIDKYCYGKNNDIEKITIPLNNGKHFNFCGYQLERVLTDLPRRIAKNDKDYVNNLRKEIKKNSSHYKINPNKFFLDNYALREFQLTDYNNLREVNKNNNNWELEKKNEIDKIFNVEKKDDLNKDKQSQLDKMFSEEKNNNLENIKKQNLS